MAVPPFSKRSNTAPLLPISADRERIIGLLNRAFVDEWIAYYQYWVGAKAAAGKMRDEAVGEFLEHANDERRHADAVLSRIAQLGGTPVRAPDKWSALANCPFANPSDPSPMAIAEQNLKAEECAIRAYCGLLHETEENDPVTHAMVSAILEDELEHKRDLAKLLEEGRTERSASALPPLSARSMSTLLLPISKRAQDPVRRTAESILKIINFLLFRVPNKDKARYLQRIRGKVMRIPIGQMSVKRMPQTASIGQAISLTKNILSGLNPFFVKRVVDELAGMMALSTPERRRPPQRRPGV